MSYLVNLVLDGRPVMVVGGGAVAVRKVHDLLAAGACVTVVAPGACEQIQALAAAGRVQFNRRAYATGDLEGAFLVVAATGEEVVNARVAEDAGALGILVNVVDRPALCTFTLPATVRRGDLTLAVATQGRCPALARAIREELEGRYGPEYAEVVRMLGELRNRMRERGWDARRTRQAITDLYQSGIAGAVRSGEPSRIEDLIRTHLGAGF
jgi:precorrin-2 dehydrogenase/sirohydrochlorin ferrochelatase